MTVLLQNKKFKTINTLSDTFFTAGFGICSETP